MKNLTLKHIIVLASIAGFSNPVFAATVFGLSGSGTTLTTFDTASPAIVSGVTTITGLLAGENITAIDFRPFNGSLYGYSNQNRLYTISSGGTATLFSNLAALTPVNPRAGVTALTGSDVASVFPPTGVVSIDVNPTVTAGVVANSGALRIVDTNAQNYRYVFDTNALNLDDEIRFPGNTGNPDIVGAAYTNNDVDSATLTELFVIDANGNLYLQSPPNDGVLVLRGALGLGTLVSTNVGFDIPVNGTTNAFASINNNFYSINLATGAASLIGALGGVGITDIAIVPEPTKGMLLLGGMGSLLFMRRRKR